MKSANSINSSSSESDNEEDPLISKVSVRSNRKIFQARKNDTKGRPQNAGRVEFDWSFKV